MCCRSTIVIKSDAKSFPAIRVLHEDKFFCDTLKAMGPIKTKRLICHPYSISRATSIDYDCCRLPTASVLSKKLENHAPHQVWPTSPRFTDHAEIRKIVIPKSVAVELELLKLAR